MVANVRTAPNAGAIGSERPDVSDGLPMGAFLHPVSLFSMGMLALNDHVLKRAEWLPGEVTGKLSDLFGLIFFPLFLTACVNTAIYVATRLLAHAGRPLGVGCTLTRPRLIAALVVTGFGFSALQLLPVALDGYAAFHALLGIEVQVYPDPSDLLTLPALGIAYRVGLTRLGR